MADRSWATQEGERYRKQREDDAALLARKAAAFDWIADDNIHGVFYSGTYSTLENESEYATLLEAVEAAMRGSGEAR